MSRRYKDRRKTQTIIPPADGWKPNTLYLVKVAYNRANPIHKALFYSGFLTDKGQPGSYNGVMQRLPNVHEVEFDPPIDQVPYLEVVRELVSEDEWKGTGKTPSQLSRENTNDNRS